VEVNSKANKGQKLFSKKQVIFVLPGKVKTNNSITL
jgi:hypothetical protein